MRAKATIKIGKSDAALQLKVIPPKGTKLNYDGPWKLILESPTIEFDPSVKQPTDLTAFDKTTESFQLKLKKANLGSELKYDLTYFLCANDNSWCRRDKISGSAKIE